MRCIIALFSLKQVLLIPQTSTVEEEEGITTVSVDRVDIRGNPETAGTSLPRHSLTHAENTHRCSIHNVIKSFSTHSIIYKLLGIVFLFNLKPLCNLLLVFFRMMRGDPRNIIEYRDLDAPEDVDFF